jgi:hypothetical protein
MTITPARLSRAAGAGAVASGLLYITVQFLHPVEEVASVRAPLWAIVHHLTLAMAVLGLAGMTAVYLRQVRQTGILGLLGYLLFSLFYLSVVANTFVEALLLPPLAETDPGFVEDFLGIFAGVPADGSLGPIESLSGVAFAFYLLGGVLLGGAVFRARVLSRWAGLLLALGAASTLVLPLLPHTVGRFAAIPVGIAVVWLGASLLSARNGSSAPDAAERGSSRLARAGAE